MTKIKEAENKEDEAIAEEQEYALWLDHFCVRVGDPKDPCLVIDFRQDNPAGRTNPRLVSGGPLLMKFIQNGEERVYKMPYRDVKVFRDSINKYLQNRMYHKINYMRDKIRDKREFAARIAAKQEKK